MEWKYKSLIFLILLIFCMSSVCAAANNTTNIAPLENTDNNVTNETIPSANKTNVTNDSVTNETIPSANKTNVTNDSVTNETIPSANKTNVSRYNAMSLEDVVNKAVEINSGELNKGIQAHKKQMDDKFSNYQKDILNRFDTFFDRLLGKNQLPSQNQTNQLPSQNQTLGDILKGLFDQKRKELDNEHEEYVNYLNNTLNNYKKNLVKELNSFMNSLAGNSANVSANKNVTVSANKNVTVSANKNVTVSANKNVTVSANKNVTVSANKNVTEIEQLKKEIEQLKKEIKELIAENNKLKKISPKTPQVSKHFIKGGMKKINRYITKNGKNPKTVKYENKSLKIKEFLNLKVIKNAKKSITQFKDKKGRLPNYVDVNGVRLYKQNYRIFFHI